MMRVGARDRVGRRALPRHQREEAQRLVARHRLGDGRDLRQAGQAFGAGHRQQLDLAALDLRQRGLDIVEHQLDLAADQIAPSPVPRRDRAHG